MFQKYATLPLFYYRYRTMFARLPLDLKEREARELDRRINELV